MARIKPTEKDHLLSTMMFLIDKLTDKQVKTLGRMTLRDWVDWLEAGPQYTTHGTERKKPKQQASDQNKRQPQKRPYSTP